MPSSTEMKVNSQKTSIMGEFAKSTQVDTSKDIEFSLLNDLVGTFGTNPVMARRAMRELLSRAPGKFFSSALTILKTGQTGPGADYLNSLMLENDLLLGALADPQAFPLPAAVMLAKNLYRMDGHLDAKLLKQVLQDDALDPDTYDINALERVLEIVDAVSDCKRLVPILMKLQRHPDARVRSKVALLLVRAHRNADWLAQQLANEDARVRANAIEGMLDTKPREQEVELLWEATKDKHHRVSSTALLVLIKNGHEKACGQLAQMAGSMSELTRAAAAWAMGMTGDVVWMEELHKMVKQDRGAARRMALKASVMLRKNAAAVVAAGEVAGVEAEPQGNVESVDQESISNGTL